MLEIQRLTRGDDTVLAMAQPEISDVLYPVASPGIFIVGGGELQPRESGETEVPQGVQRRSPGRESSILQTLLTYFDCRNDQNSKLCDYFTLQFLTSVFRGGKFAHDD